MINETIDKSILDRAYTDYFGEKEESQIPPSSILPTEGKPYTYEMHKDGKPPIERSQDIPASNNDRWLAEDNIDDVDELAEHIRLVLNAAWGDKWGLFGPELKEGENPEDIVLPQITYDVVTRIIPDKKPIKPTQMDTIQEVVSGQPTGDYFQLYRQWFDCVIEFNVCGKNALESRRLSKRFETIIATYTGHLKQVGASEILFLKEVHASQSSNYRDDIPMRCLLYLARIERITVVKASTIRNMEIALTTKGNPTDQKSASTTYKV